MEHQKKLHRGKKTFFFIFLTKSWVMVLIGAGIIYLAWLTMYGSLYPHVESFFLNRPEFGMGAADISQLLLILGLGVLLLSYLRARLTYRHLRFLLDEYSLTVHRGLYFTHETTIPYHQISNVYIVRPYHYKIFGIARLDIITAADRSMENDTHGRKFLIPIIDVAIARRLSRYLLEKAARHRNEMRREAFEEDEEENEDEDAEDTDESDESEKPASRE